MLRSMFSAEALTLAEDSCISSALSATERLVPWMCPTSSRRFSCMLPIAVVSSSTSSRPRKLARSVARGFDKSPRLISSALRFKRETRFATCLRPTETARATMRPSTAPINACSGGR